MRWLEQTPDRFMADILASIKSRFWTDARKGVKLNQLGYALRKLGPSYSTERVLRTRSRSLLGFPYMNIFTEKDLATKPDRIRVLGIGVGFEKAHAVILLGSDFAKKTIQYIDPNFPDRVLSSRYDVSWPVVVIDWHERYGQGTQTVGSLNEILDIWLD